MDPVELARIGAAGGFVDRNARICGNLAVARAIGENQSSLSASLQK
jgi:Protein phosphatase 2C